MNKKHLTSISNENNITTSSTGIKSRRGPSTITATASNDNNNNETVSSSSSFNQLQPTSSKTTGETGSNHRGGHKRAVYNSDDSGNRLIKIILNINMIIYNLFKNRRGITNKHRAVLSSHAKRARRIRDHSKATPKH